MSSLLLPRLAIALVWLYQGLWCKLLGRVPRHQQILERASLLGLAAHRALLALGGLECLLAVWVLSGLKPQSAAIAETALLLSMNAGGLLWARQLIPDPVQMLLNNFVFVLLAWGAAGANLSYATHF
jgi:hypothetical protein